MAFFDFLKSNNQNSEQKKEFSNIDELLGINLSDLPDDSFIVSEIIDNGHGDMIRNYNCTDDKNIYSLFNYIEIKKFIGKPNKNFVFSNKTFNNMNKLKELINNLYQIYGYDDINSHKFTMQDELDIKSGYWSGRNWLNFDKFKTPIMISYDSNEGLSMTIFKTE